MTLHERLVRAGDALDVAAQWMVAACFWAAAVFAAVILGTVGFLEVVTLIGGR